MKRARTSGCQEGLGFETEFLNLLRIDADRRAAHEIKMEHLASKLLEEIQVTRQSLVAAFMGKDLH